MAESAPRWKYDVFLSFRGEDTRKGFTSHLYHELQHWQAIKTFKDDQELDKGANISPELLSAIEHSQRAIVVLSPNYASSTWCLDELAKIVESMEMREKAILPVFLDVDPSDVRHQRNSFAQAFAKHEERFSDDVDKVKRWRAALTKVANLSGWHSNGYKCERELIKAIVKFLWDEVRPTITLSNSTDHKLVGIDFRLVDELGSRLDLEAKDVRFIGLWGMGGVGKTTLARLVFDRFSHHFEVSEFLADVREVFARERTLVSLQKQFLFPILKENTAQVWDEQRGIFFIQRCLCNKKVLLVVDDVDHYNQLELLAGNKSWFGEGSRIIVTTRDKRVLIGHDIESFEVAGLNNSNSIELFSRNAFKKDEPEEEFSKLSQYFVDYCKGLPLALKILGLSLYKKRQDEWNSVLHNLKKSPDEEIFSLLKISYDGLCKMSQIIFLDVAFFHKGKDKDQVIEILDRTWDISSLSGINGLIEKSLLTIERVNKIEMHDLIQEMAWEIVRKESSEEEPGRRSRLCHRDDIFNVFIRNTGTEAIKGISLCLPNLEEADSNWSCEVFSNMLNLRFLKFYNFRISLGPKFLPNSLRILTWNWYPSEYLPASFRPNFLGELRMLNSELVRLWDGKLDLPNLKTMDLRFSKNLIKTPDFTGIPNLEDLNLENCTGLVEIDPSIAFNKKLKRWILSGCDSIKKFPSKLEMDSLEFLNLRGCSKVKSPEFGEGMKNLSGIWLSETASEELPSSIEHLVGLTNLFLGNCKGLKSLQGTAIFKLTSLESLHMNRLPKLEKFVEKSSIRQKIRKLPDEGLLGLIGRKSPEPLGFALPSPRLLPSLSWLQLGDCNLYQGAIPDDIGYCFPSLKELVLCGNNFVSLPTSIKCLSKLRSIDLERCKRLQQLPDLPSNRKLKVRANDCDSLKMLSEPSRQGRFPNLEKFELIAVNCLGLGDEEGLNNGIFSLLRRLATQGISPDFHSSSIDYDPERRPSFNIVSCGSKISEWFNIQSEGDSLTVELPPPDRKPEWTGIMFCVVFADHKNNPTLLKNNSTITCSSQGIDGQRSVNITKNLRDVKGDHVWVFYMSHSQIQETTNCRISFSFHTCYSGCCKEESLRPHLGLNSEERYGARFLNKLFAPSKKKKNKPCAGQNSVKRCGARLLYEPDLKQLRETES